MDTERGGVLLGILEGGTKALYSYGFEFFDFFTQADVKASFLVFPFLHVRIGRASFILIRTVPHQCNLKHP